MTCQMCAAVEFGRTLTQQLAKLAEEKAKTERGKGWPPTVVPESLGPLYAEQSDAGRDFRIMVEDRRVTDVSADYWMKETRDLRAKLEAADRQIAELGLEVASHKDAADKAEAKREREVDYACDATKALMEGKIDTLTQLLREAKEEILIDECRTVATNNLLERIEQAIESEVKS